MGTECVLIYCGAVAPTRAGRARRLAPDARRRALVEATLPLVLRDGAAVSTRAIAEAAGVAEGTIFRVFPDKDALIHAVTVAALDPGPTLRELTAVDRDLPLRVRLTAGVRILQASLVEKFALLAALGLPGPRPTGEVCTGPPTAMNDAFRAALADLVGPDADALRVPATELAHVLRLLVFSATHPRICDEQPLTAEQIVSVLLDGMARAPHGVEGRAC